MKIRKVLKTNKAAHAIHSYTDMSQDPEIRQFTSSLPFTVNGYLFEEVIGTGSYGIVFKVYHYGYKRSFAAKMLYAKDDQEVTSQFESEINILLHLMHPNIIKIYEHFKYLNRLVMVFQYCSNGTLKNLIQPSFGIQHDYVIPFMKQMTEALNYLHSHKIAHLDIKTTNVFVDNFMRPVLADFGLSLQSDGIQQINSFSGSFIYRSPEMIQQHPYDPFKADVWALGVTFYIMVTGNTPWQMYNPEVLKSSIINGKYEIPPNVDPEIADVINKMLVIDPVMRPSISEVVSLPFFQKVHEPIKINLKGGVGISHQMSQNRCIKLMATKQKHHYLTSSSDVFNAVTKTDV